MACGRDIPSTGEEGLGADQGWKCEAIKAKDVKSNEFEEKLVGFVVNYRTWVPDTQLDFKTIYSAGVDLGKRSFPELLRSLVLDPWVWPILQAFPRHSYNTCALVSHTLARATWETYSSPRPIRSTCRSLLQAIIWAPWLNSRAGNYVAVQ